MKAMYKSFGFNSQQASSSKQQQQQQPQSHQRNPPPPLPTKAAAARLLWASFRVWYENEKASFEADFKNLCREMDMVYSISESEDNLKSRQETLRNERGVALAQNSMKKWDDELKHNDLTWEDWSDITPDEQAQVEEVFRSARQVPTTVVMEHSLLQAPPLSSSSSTSLIRTPPYNMIDPSAFSDDADEDDRMGFVDIQSFMEDSHRSHLDNEVVSDSEFVSWNAETPQTSSHSPSPRISPRHLSVHSSFENIPTLHTPVAHRASDNTKPRSGYIGPELVSSPPPSQSSSPLQDADEEAEFERFRANVRAEKIREFHNEAAEADIQLSSEIYNAQKHGLVNKDEIIKMVQMHEKRMMLVRKTKDEERKKIVATEREKRRKEIKERAAAANQGALVVRRERKNTITGYTSPLLNSSSSGKPSLEGSPDGFWAQAMMKLQPSPLDTPIANFADPPSWTSYYEAPAIQQHPQSPPISARNMFSPSAMEPSFPGAFDPKMSVHSPRHDQQPSLSSSISDDNSIWSHIGAGVSANNGGDSPATSSPSEKAGVLSQAQPGSPVKAKIAPPAAEISTKQAKANAKAAVANVAQGKPAALPTVTKVAPTTSSTSQKAASVTPTPPSTNGKASQDRPVLHSAASQQAGVAAPQPKAPAPPVVTKQVVPAPQKMIRKMQAVTKPPPQAAPKPAAMQSPVKTIPQTPQQQNKQSLALPVVSTRQNSSSASAAAAGYHTTHERWIPPAAPAPAPAPATSTSQKAAGKKPEAKAADLIFPLAKASEAKPPVIKMSESKGPAAVKVAESKSTNSLPTVPPPSRVDASASSKPATTSSASNSTWQTPAANATWQPPPPPAAAANAIWQPSGAPPAAAPALSSSASSASASASAASSQSQMFWRPQQPQEKAKQEEKPRKQIEPAPAAAPASSHHSSSSTKKGGKKNKAKATVQVEEVPDDEAVAKDALPLDSRYLLEPVGGAPPLPAEPKPTKPSPFFDKVLKFDGDGGDDGSSDGTVRVGKKHKERKASIPPEWGNSASANMMTDNKHVRWSPNTALPSSMFNPHPAAPSAMSASDPGEHFWKAATEQLSSPQKKAAALPKKQIVENEFDRIAREALQSLSSGR